MLGQSMLKREAVAGHIYRIWLIIVLSGRLLGLFSVDWFDLGWVRYGHYKEERRI